MEQDSSPPSDDLGLTSTSASASAHAITRSSSGIGSSVGSRVASVGSSVSSNTGVGSGGDYQEVPSVILELKATPRKSVGEVLQAVKAALDAIAPQGVDYECSSDTSFRLNGQSDLMMELEVCSETPDGHVPGLQVRKLSGDSLEYAKLCNHLMACVNN